MSERREERRKLRYRFGGITVVAMLVATAASAQAPLPQELERVLLPVATGYQDGASGSRWATAIWMIVDEDRVFIGPIRDRFCESPTCGPPPPPPPPPGYAITPTVFRTLPGETPGILLYVDKSKADKVSFSIRVADVNQRTLSSGDEVPVVRERDVLVNRPIHLLNVPAGSGMRFSIRIYDVDAIGGEVLLREFHTPTTGPPSPTLLREALVLERVVELQIPSENDAFPGRSKLPLRPAAAEIHLEPIGDQRDRVRFEITPLRRDLRLWAFATATNDLTNEVTVISPD